MRIEGEKLEDESFREPQYRAIYLALRAAGPEKPDEEVVDILKRAYDNEQPKRVMKMAGLMVPTERAVSSWYAPRSRAVAVFQAAMDEYLDEPGPRVQLPELKNSALGKIDGAWVIVDYGNVYQAPLPQGFGFRNMVTTRPMLRVTEADTEAAAETTVATGLPPSSAQKRTRPSDWWTTAIAMLPSPTAASLPSGTNARRRSAVRACPSSPPSHPGEGPAALRS